MKSLFYVLAVVAIIAAGFYGWKAKENYRTQLADRDTLIAANKILSKNIKEKELEDVLAMLDKHGLKENTIFCYSSDHGNGTGAKYTVYDRGLNVPFIVRWPGKVKPGRTDALASYVDVLPTFVDIAGGQPLEESEARRPLQNSGQLLQRAWHRRLPRR